MGQKMLAGCKLCDHSRVIVSVGGTRSDFLTYDPFPAICKNCQELTSVNLRVEPLTCSVCQSTNVVQYGEATKNLKLELNKLRAHWSNSVSKMTVDLPGSSGNRDYSPWYDGQHLCPKCNQYGFEFGPTVAFYD